MYLNDGTGSKMDYYLQKTVVSRQLGLPEGRSTDVGRPGHHQEHGTSRCRDEPARYVTGGGDFGVEPGKIQTLLAAYAPEDAIFLGATRTARRPPCRRRPTAGTP